MNFLPVNEKSNCPVKLDIEKKPNRSKPRHNNLEIRSVNFSEF